MEQYISKSAVVAEIENLEKLYCYGKSDGMLIAKSVFDSIKNIINTLEVKEVNEIDIPVSHSLTEEGLFTFEDGSQAIITKIE